MKVFDLDNGKLGTIFYCTIIHHSFGVELRLSQKPDDATFAVNTYGLYIGSMQEWFSFVATRILTRFVDKKLVTLADDGNYRLSQPAFDEWLTELPELTEQQKG